MVINLPRYNLHKQDGRPIFSEVAPVLFIEII